MTKLTDEAGLALWERALAAEIGLRVKTGNVKLLSNALYTVRKALGEGRFDSLVITFPGGLPDQLWIVHNNVKLEE